MAEGGESMSTANLSRKERWVIGLVLTVSMLMAGVLCWLPDGVALKVTLLISAGLFPLLILRSSVFAWGAFRRQRRVQAVLASLLTLLFCFGFLGELGKLIAVLAE